MKVGKVFFGILTALTLGLMGGILLAPRKGSKTRKDILDTGEDYTERFKNNFDGFLKNLTKKVKNISYNAKETVSKDKDKHEQAQRASANSLP